MRFNIKQTRSPFAAQVYKTVADPFVGKLSVFKILGGNSH